MKKAVLWSFVAVAAMGSLTLSSFKGYDMVADVNASQLQALQVDSTDTSAEAIYDVVDEIASFPGGEEPLKEWIGKNMLYPEQCQRENVQGMVVVSFIVEQDGSISDVKATRSPHPALAEEAIRMIKSMPQWKPAIQTGKAVRSRFNLPIRFRLSNQHHGAEE